MTSAVDGVGGQRHSPAAFTLGKDPLPIVENFKTPKFKFVGKHCKQLHKSSNSVLSIMICVVLISCVSE
jgi:hypothetical protein